MPRLPSAPSPAKTLRRSSLAFLIFWLLLALLLWAIFKWFENQKQASLRAYSLSTGELVIPRSPDGHFYIDGEVNHAPVLFLVDTGASSVAVSEQTARAAQLPAGAPITLSTAGGQRPGELVRKVPVKAGPLVANDTNVIVGLQMDSPKAALLGQSFLRHFEVSISAQEMIVRPAGSQAR